MSVSVRLSPSTEAGAISMVGFRPREVAEVLEQVLELAGFTGMLVGSVRKIIGNNVKDVAFRSIDGRTNLITVAVRVGENCFSCRLDLPADIHPLEIKVRLEERECVASISHDMLKAIVESPEKLRELSQKQNKLIAERHRLMEQLRGVEKEIKENELRRKKYTLVYELAQDFGLDQ